MSNMAACCITCCATSPRPRKRFTIATDPGAPTRAGVFPCPALGLLCPKISERPWPPASSLSCSFGLFLAFVAVMASVTFFVRDPLPIVGPNQQLVLETNKITPPRRAEIAVDGEYKVLFDRSHRWTRQTACALRFTDSDDIPLVQQGEAAEAQFTRTGRWELVLVSGGAEEVLAFVLRD